jgi:hypothetical protein
MTRPHRSQYRTEPPGSLSERVYNVITDMSDAKSVLQELQAIVPSGPKFPLQPIIVAAQEEPGMFDSFEAYSWFLRSIATMLRPRGRAARSIRRAGHPPRRGQASGALGVGGSSPLNRRGAKASVLPQRRLDPGSFPCSSRPPSKPSPPFPGPRKSPTAAGIRALGLGVRRRNVTVNCSPNAHSSPELGAWPIYSTSFFPRDFSGLYSLFSRKVGIPFACHLQRWLPQTLADTAPTLECRHSSEVAAPVDDSPRLWCKCRPSVGCPGHGTRQSQLRNSPLPRVSHRYVG